MLDRLKLWSHVVVGLTIAVCVGAAAYGILGGRGERFDAKQITVSPDGVNSNGVRIREVVDQDFGDSRRHGYERVIPLDAGTPAELEASSPDADASVDTEYVSDFGGAMRVRLGDKDVTYSGQHRYILGYTLPALGVQSGQLNIDIIAAGEDLETGRFEVIVVGFDLTDTECNVGATGDVGGCTLQNTAPGEYRVVFEPLSAGDGVNLRGQIVGRIEVTLPEIPALPPRAESHRLRTSLLVLVAGLAAAVVAFVYSRQRGRNEVFSGGAVEAAYGRPAASIIAGGPPPAAGTSGAGTEGTAPAGITLVPDSRMDELTTIEFVPPKGLDPWHGAVLHDEEISQGAIGAWFSALAASEALTLREVGNDLVIGIGPRFNQLDPTNAEIINGLLAGRPEVQLGKYDPQFAAAWGTIQARQRSFMATAGWWKRGGPGQGTAAALLKPLVFLILILGGSIIAGLSDAPGLLDFLHSQPLAVAIGFVLPGLAAMGAYASLRPRLSAVGSSYAILTESFRRFLAASEGRHVEWAWSQGLLREYSAWAVALGAADAWGDALRSSGVPRDAFGASNPLLIHHYSSAMASSHTKPSSSGSSGGGGGGGVGGGGGGGSSGSW